MDERLATLKTILDQTATIIDDIEPDQHTLATPCSDYDVGELLDHVVVWVQVFSAAVNDTSVDFDPMTHRIGGGWGEIFRTTASAIVDGLETRGLDRPMTMTGDPIPGEFVLNMLLMEYLGHGWDLCRSTGRRHPYRDAEATVALGAAKSIIEPQYRGAGMFGDEIDVGPSADAVDQLIGFIGRDPGWTAAPACTGSRR